MFFDHSENESLVLEEIFSVNEVDIFNSMIDIDDDVSPQDLVFFWEELDFFFC